MLRGYSPARRKNRSGLCISRVLQRTPRGGEPQAPVLPICRQLLG